MRLFCSILVLWVTACCGVESPLFIGDSITQGFHVPSADRFAERFRALGFYPVNAGVGGDFTDNGATRLPALLAAHNPRSVVIMYGTNDSGPINPAGDYAVPIARFRENLLYMISLCRQKNATVYLCTPIPGRYEVAWRNARLQAYVDCVRDICARKRSVKLIDNYKAWAEKNVVTYPYNPGDVVVQPDLLFIQQMIPATEGGGVNYFHPNSAGHAFIFETMRKVIAP